MIGFEILQDDDERLIKWLKETGKYALYERSSQYARVVLKAEYMEKQGFPEVARQLLDEHTSADAIQVGGSHYKDKSIQPWAAMESWMSKEAFTGYLQGNVIKYVARYRDKGGVEDLKKAQHYLTKLIEVQTNAV